MIDRVGAALDGALATAGRREIVDAALAPRTHGARPRSGPRGARSIDDLAPEHLQLLVADPDAFLGSVRNAGAVFLGPWSAVPFGDYGVASNHVLPTAGTARFASGLRAADYVTVRSVVEMTAASASATGARDVHDRAQRRSGRTRGGHGRTRDGRTTS